jgi:hypothetical protein
MKRVFLVIEPKSLRLSPSGKALANIWLQINGLQFPMNHWNDFVVVIMSWWVLALLRLVSGVSSQEIVHFMDGPYAVEVAALPSGMLRFRALTRSSRDREVATGEEPINPFVLGLIAQTREVLEECKRQAWWSKDAEILESSSEALKKMTATNGEGG